MRSVLKDQLGNYIVLSDIMDLEQKINWDDEVVLRRLIRNEIKISSVKGIFETRNLVIDYMNGRALTVHT